MRFLIDNALSPYVADGLRGRGHDAVHIRDLSLQSADDIVVFELAAREGRTLVSADTDFGTLLALSEAREPSVVLFRRGMERKPREQLPFLLAHMATIESAATKGAIIVLEESRLRIRYLPIAGACRGLDAF